MVHLKRLSILALALVFTATLSSSASAIAHGNQSDDQATATSSETSQSSESEAEHSGLEQRKAQFRKKAEDDVAKKRSELSQKKAKNSEERRKRCESHKQGLTNKFERIVNKSQKIQTRIDKILDKAQAYSDTSGIVPDNYASLLAAAQAAKTTSAASITDLQAISPTIDCNSESVASDVATFKAAAAKVRDDLKAYKTSVKALLKSLKEAKPASESEGTN